MTNLRESCYATLVYFDLFDYPLTFSELERFFLGKLPSSSALQDFLDHENGVQTLDGYYFLKGREALVKTRTERENVAQMYWKKVKFYLPFLQAVPFLKMVGVCNTLAFNNPTHNSDIDLFIVAKKGRLFIVRFFTVLILSLLGVRRHGNKIAGRFCLSFYVTENALNLEPIQFSAEDIYLTYWILTLRPVYGLETYEKFCEANHWIEKYFGRDPFQHSLVFLRNSWLFRLKGKFWEFFMGGKLGDKLEKKFMNVQLKRHEHTLRTLGKEASVVVTEQMLKFHNIDRRREIAEKFSARLHHVLFS